MKWLVSCQEPINPFILNIISSMGSCIQTVERNNSKEYQISKVFQEKKSNSLEPSKSITLLLQSQSPKQLSLDCSSDSAKYIPEMTERKRKSWTYSQLNATKQKFKQSYHNNNQVYLSSNDISKTQSNVETNINTNNETNSDNNWNDKFSEKLKMSKILEDFNNELVIATHSDNNLHTRSCDPNDTFNHNNCHLNQNFHFSNNISNNISNINENENENHNNICHICSLRFDSIESYKHHIQVSFIFH